MAPLHVLALALLVATAVPTGEGYILVPDCDGNVHVVNLTNVQPEDTPMPFFNGEEDVALMLYTRNNPSTPEYILESDPSKSPSFNPANPTRFVIHGWTSSHKQMVPICQAYMNTTKDYNVVLVDWHNLACCDYGTSKLYSRCVGEYLAQVIKHLVADRGLSLDDLCIIGHSLGAQAAGVAGNRLGGLAGCICGLDAAAPLFGTTSEKNRLDPSDAKCVQGIHTNAGCLGWKDPLGHVDFYPNGGSYQCGCFPDVCGVCSHNRAVDYYAESVVSLNFLGAKCDNYLNYENRTCCNNSHATMGEWTNFSVPGSFYLNTNPKSPYAQGDTGL